MLTHTGHAPVHVVVIVTVVVSIVISIIFIYRQHFVIVIFVIIRVAITSTITITSIVLTSFILVIVIVVVIKISLTASWIVMKYLTISLCVNVIGPPLLICFLKSGTTDPDEAKTLPNLTIENRVGI